jgi:hypothetical protein
MKVAILLTGQLRTVEMLKYLHLNSLILKYNANVFLGVNLNNDTQNNNKNLTIPTTLQEINNVIDFFKPIDTFILNNFNRQEIKHNGLMFEQYYVVKKAYELLKTYSDKNNIKYDLIIRLRFDQLIFSDEVPICHELYNHNLSTILYNHENINILKNYSIDKKFIFDEINDNTIYVFGFGNFEHYKYANDQFFYHNHSLLEKMMNFYDNIFNIMNYCNKKKIGNKGALIECILYLYITQFNNIILKKSNIYGIFIRQLI